MSASAPEPSFHHCSRKKNAWSCPPHSFPEVRVNSGAEAKSLDSELRKPTHLSSVWELSQVTGGPGANPFIFPTLICEMGPYQFPSTRLWYRQDKVLHRKPQPRVWPLVGTDKQVSVYCYHAPWEVFLVLTLVFLLFNFILSTLQTFRFYKNRKNSCILFTPNL